MTKNVKCRARGGVANCKRANCPEKHPAATASPVIIDGVDFDALDGDMLARGNAVHADIEAFFQTMPTFESFIAPDSAAPVYAGKPDNWQGDADDDDDWDNTTEWGNNPVDAPGKFGMVAVGSASLPTYPGDYGYYSVAVVKDSKGYYLSTDSGCSCPTPWENHTMADFTGPMTAEQVLEEVQSLHDACDEDHKSEWTRNDVGELRARVFMDLHPEITSVALATSLMGNQQV